MDINSKRKELRETHFSFLGMMIVTVLGLVGIFIVYMFGLFEMTSFSEFYDALYNNGIAIIVGIFFIFVCLYCYFLSFVNLVLKPKEDIVYLYKKEDSIYFVDRNGKKILYGYSPETLTEEKYYLVLRTRDCIYYIYNETHGDWTPKSKKSFWLTWYSPVGLWEDIFLLPIVYVIFIPGFLSILMSEGFDKIYGIIWCVFPGYLIGYDIYFKLKNK